MVHYSFRRTAAMAEKYSEYWCELWEEQVLTSHWFLKLPPDVRCLVRVFLPPIDAWSWVTLEEAKARDMGLGISSSEENDHVEPKQQPQAGSRGGGGSSYYSYFDVASVESSSVADDERRSETTCTGALAIRTL